VDMVMRVEVADSHTTFSTTQDLCAQLSEHGVTLRPIQTDCAIGGAPVPELTTVIAEAGTRSHGVGDWRTFRQNEMSSQSLEQAVLACELNSALERRHVRHERGMGHEPALERLHDRAVRIVGQAEVVGRDDKARVKSH